MIPFPSKLSYEELVAACRRGEYPHAMIRSASGRLNHLFGISPSQLKSLGGLAKDNAVGMILLGSRVSGPRLRQRTLHPVLEHCLPLETKSRAPSALYPGVESGVIIEKIAIKDFGRSDHASSDLGIVLIDAKRTDAELCELAKSLEKELSTFSERFPVYVYAHIRGARFKTEAEFRVSVTGALRGMLTSGISFPDKEICAGLEELYAPLNLPHPIFVPGDFKNGALAAVLFSISFSMGLGFHPVLPAVGFFFGTLGRYIARARAWVAFGFGDSLLSNGAALCVDAGIGIFVMAALIAPAAGLDIPFQRIVAGSLSHTASKGALRLYLDKRFSTQHSSSQVRGVLIVSLLNFFQGTVTSFVYAGSTAAFALQAALTVLGLGLVFLPPLARVLRKSPS